MRVANRKLFTISGAVLALFLAVSLAAPRAAHANDAATLNELKKLARQAMENYDLMEYEEAKRLLNRAIATAKRKRMNDHPLTAQLYLHLGIVYFSGFQDVESAKVAFIDAVSIDPAIMLNPAYKTGEMEKLLAEAKSDFGGGSGADTGGSSDPDPVVEEPVASGPDCGTLVGIAHTLVDSAPAATEQEIVTHVSPELGASKISLFYRTQGKADFTEAAMQKRGACGYAGMVPADAMKGDVLHYYVAVFNDSGKIIAKKGSAASPNIMELRAAGGAVGAAGAGDDVEDPLSGRRSGGSSGGSVSKGAGAAGGSKFFVALAVGSGGGYVSGETEQAVQEVSCCFAPAPLHVLPEIGYRLSAKNAVSLAFRLGLPLGADLPGHATAAPAALLRYHHAFSASGAGLAATAAIGGGLIRHTVPLAGDMGTDTAATGPLLVGGGLGWIKPLGSSLKFVADLSTLLGVPVVDEVGASRTNFAVQIDASLGLQVGF